MTKMFRPRSVCADCAGKPELIPFADAISLLLPENCPSKNTTN